MKSNLKINRAFAKFSIDIIFASKTSMKLGGDRSILSLHTYILLPTNVKE
ncbi:MAG: hypothetical protein ACI9P5_002882, partial [Saprospiraceae bacterium]